MSIVCNLSMLVRKKTEKRKEKRKKQEIETDDNHTTSNRSRRHAHTHIPNTPTPHTTPTYYEKNSRRFLAEICLTFSIQVLG